MVAPLPTPSQDSWHWVHPKEEAMTVEPSGKLLHRIGMHGVLIQLPLGAGVSLTLELVAPP